MERPTDLSRRFFLTGGRCDTPFPTPSLRPPWLLEDAILGCTGCGSCTEACPTGVVHIVERTATVDFTQGECTFCGACAESCPEHLFDLSTIPFEHVVEISGSCLTYAGVTCRSCGDACPEMAIRFPPRIGGPFLPQINASACTGCGACIAPCPAGATGLAPMREVANA
ncbi:ferredoxin-type protein NapF [Stappia sp.]|uniref:ferredoxin-type protein NapF n=1 Tax=Stappia sp. TaxID=1870903 RepID=UPI003A99628D